jgi:predicted outer membrane protein
MSAKKMLLATGLLAVTLFTSCNLNSNRDPDMDDYAVSTTNTLDRRFVQNASEGNTAEIMTSNLALSHYANDTTKNFALMMRADHQFAQDQLRKISTPLEIETPGEDYLDSVHYKLHQELKNLAVSQGKTKTREWDKRFMEIQLMMHDKAIALYSAEANNASGNKTLVDFAAKQLVKIQDHRRMADSIYARLK